MRTLAGAAGLIFGRASEDEYADEIVNREDVVATRRKVVAIVDDSIDEAAVEATATVKDGTTVHVRVDHAIGSLQRPMSDDDLVAKFSAMSEPVLGKDKTRKLVDLCWNLAIAVDVKALTGQAT